MRWMVGWWGWLGWLVGWCSWQKNLRWSSVVCAPWLMEPLLPGSARFCNKLTKLGMGSWRDPQVHRLNRLLSHKEFYYLCTFLVFSLVWQQYLWYNLYWIFLTELGHFLSMFLWCAYLFFMSVYTCNSKTARYPFCYFLTSWRTKSGELEAL